MNDRIVLIAVALASAAGGAAIYAAATATPAAKAAPMRPSGMMYLTTMEDKSVVRLNADTVLGARASRQGWFTTEVPAKGEAKQATRNDLVRANCATTGFKILSFVLYDEKGESKESWNENPNFPAATEYPVPGSVAEVMINALCDQRYDAPAKKKV